MKTSSSEWWNANKLRFVLWKNTWFTIGTQYQECFSWVTITNNLWNNFVCVYNWSTIVVYINWIVWTASNYTAWWWYTATSYIRIGTSNRNGVNDEFFNWNIDELWLENRAWTASEIKKYYTASKWRFWIL
jgi:hypothetical protein